MPEKDQTGDEDLVVGDSRDAAVILGARLSRGQQIMATITSPPYWNLKNYGAPGQVGWRQGYDAYLDDCESIFKQVYEKTANAGALWIVSDTMLNRTSKPRSLINLPNDLAARAAAAGWFLRDVYIWQKDRTIPYTSHGRLRNSFEYIHYYVKTEEFKFRSDRLRDPINLASWWVQYPERYNPRGKAPTNVWTYPIPTQGAWSNGSVQHACPLPPDMVERMILLSTDEGDLVFDPFAGTGTVLSEARRLRRRGFGIELNPNYVEQYRLQMRDAVLERVGDDSAVLAAKEATRLSALIRRLRVVKYPKSLSKLYSKVHSEPLDAVALFVESSRFTPKTLATLTVIVNSDASEQELGLIQERVSALRGKYPLSQFQVEMTIDVRRASEFVSDEPSKQIYFYEHGRTWSTSQHGSREELVSLSRSGKVGKYLPIGSNIRLREEAHRPYA
jgi:DNA modification methylase